MRNPDWTRDELIMALDLYMQFGGNPPGKASPEIVGLSDLLRRMGAHIEKKLDTYRNPNGVYMKIMNFRSHDPKYTEAGKTGLSSTSAAEDGVWSDFANAPVRLQEVAALIRNAVDAGIILPSSQEEDEGMEAEEGKILTRLHRSRERNRKLVEKKKTQVLERDGFLKCEACEFDFAKTYGERGRGKIVAHHTIPVHTLKPNSKTKLADLALVCANCHTMIHSSRLWLTMEELRALIAEAAP